MKIKEIPLFLGVLSLVLVLIFGFLFRLEPTRFDLALAVFAYICLSLLVSIFMLQVINIIVFKKVTTYSTNRHATFIFAIILQAIYLLKIAQVPANSTFNLAGVLFIFTAPSTAICYLVLSAISFYKEKIKK